MFSRPSRPVRSLAQAGSARGLTRHLVSTLGLCAPLLVLAQALTSCGSDDDGGAACEPNVIRACAGPGSCSGEQTCAADGSGYSECSCDGSGSAGAAGGGAGGSANAGAAANGAGSTAGSGGTAPSPDNPLFPPELGAIGSPCASDAECPTGPNGEQPLRCITADSTDFGEGGPQGGYCTLACNDSDQCAAVDGPSVCGLQDDAGNGFCFRLCQPGPQGVKCPGVAQACLPPPADAAVNVGICFPICTSDLACGGGLFCSLAEQGGALCGATAPVGGDVGAPCTPETEDTDCKSGLCVTLAGDPPVSFCSDFCTFGNFAEGCGFSPDSGLPREAICGLTVDPGGDVGDLGLCLELCDTAADCGQPDWTCEDLPVDGQEAFGRQGQCVPPGAIDPAPDAGVGG